MARTSDIRWDDDDDDDVRFVLDTVNTLSWINFYSATLLKVQSGVHVEQLGHIILIPSQSVLALTP